MPCTLKTEKKEKVTSKLPSVNYQLQNLWRHAFIISFSADMVNKEQIGSFLANDQLPFTMAPELDWSGVWLDQKTLQLNNASPYPLGEKVILSPTKGITALNGSPIVETKSFIPFPFFLDTYSQVKYSKTGKATFELFFQNGVVTPELVRQNTFITTHNSTVIPIASAIAGKEKNQILIDFIPPYFGKMRLSFRPNFTAEKGKTPLTTLDRIRSGNATDQVYVNISPSSLLDIQSVQSYQTSSPPWERAIRITPTRPVAPDTLKKHMTLTPEMDYTIDVNSDSSLIINGDFSTRNRVEVTIHKGLPSADGRGILNEDSKNIVTFKDFAPRLALGEQGTVTSPNVSLHIPLTSLNVDRVGIVLRELPESSVPLIAANFYSSYRESLAQVVAVSRADIGGVLNKVSERSIDVGNLTKGKKGIFFLSVEDITEREKWTPSYLRSSYYDSNRSDTLPNLARELSTTRWAQKIVVVSDIGLVARQFPNGLTVWANSLATAKPLSQVSIKVYSSTNVLLAEGETDKAGMLTITRENPWKREEEPALIVASTPAKKQQKKKSDTPLRGYDDLTYLLLNNNLLTSNDAFDIGGKAYLTEGYEALCFATRGVFRPGETVPIRALVRDKTMTAPQPFPISWQIIAPTGKTAGQGSVKLTEQGIAAFDFALIPAAATGKYSVEIFLPGQKHQVIGRTSFAVEELAPPRLDIHLRSDVPYVTAGDDIPIQVQANYLFGAPVTDARWEANFTLVPSSFTPKGWSDYSFEIGSYPCDLDEDNSQGVLDSKSQGRILIPTTAPKLKGYYFLQTALKVKEDGGRFVTSTISVPVFADKIQFGYQNSRQLITAGSKTDLNVCAVTPDGKGAKIDASYKIVLASHYYHWSTAGYTANTDYQALVEGKLSLKEGKGTVAFTPKKDGEYVLVLIDSASKATRAIPFTVWPGSGERNKGASPLVDRVMLSWDKEAYADGEIAKLKIQSPFTGTMLLIVESNRENWKKIIQLDKTETTIDIPVRDDFGPNAYAIAWVIRPVKKEEVTGAHRAFGLIPLFVNKNKAKLQVEIAAKETTLPSSTMPVSIQLRDSKGAPVQGEVILAFVDEGLLSLSRYQTPKPFEFFTEKRALATLFFDRYDELIPICGKKPLTLAVGGGDALEGSSRLSALTRKLVLLNIAHEVITTDAQGKATTSFTIPEYSGKGRIMAIAASKNALGSAAKSVTVARDITVEGTTPRMLAPEDVFSMPIFVFASSKEISSQTAIVTVATSGPLAVKGNHTFTVTLDKNTPKVSLDVPIEAQKETGLGKIIITTNTPGSKEDAFTQTLEVPVRSPFPREVKKLTGTITPEKPARITFPKGFAPGSQAGRLVFSKTPEVSLASALEYLNYYPHGCLEQTVSTTWPYVGVPAMLKNIEPDMAGNDAYQKSLDLGVRRILGMQRTDGGFVMWPGDDMYSKEAFGWGSVYAMHLLTELKNSGSPLVPADAYLTGTYWLKRTLAKPIAQGSGLEYELNLRAYIAFVLTLQGEPPLGWMQFLKDQGTTLSTSAKIFLAGAYALAEGKADALIALGTEPYPTQNAYGWSYESSTRNEALRLFMWALSDPFSPQAALFAERVLEAGASDQWTNTQENAMAVLALGKYLEKTAQAKGPFSATITKEDAAGKETALTTFSSAKLPVLTTKDLFQEGKDVPSLIVSLKNEEKETPGMAYYSLVVAGAPLKAPPASESGLSLMRRWTLPDTTKAHSFTMQKNGTRLQSEQRVEVEQGDLIDVTLFIEAAQNVTSLVITDIAPGGFEIENPNLIPRFDEDNTGFAVQQLKKELLAINDAPPIKTPQLLNGCEGVRAEIRDDRIIIYVNTPPKTSAFHYQLRALSKGTYILPPAQAEGMYDTTLHSLTLPGKVSIYAPGEKATKGDAARVLEEQ